MIGSRFTDDVFHIICVFRLVRQIFWLMGVNSHSLNLVTSTFWRHNGERCRRPGVRWPSSEFENRHRAGGWSVGRGRRAVGDFFLLQKAVFGTFLVLRKTNANKILLPNSIVLHVQTRHGSPSSMCKRGMAHHRPPCVNEAWLTVSPPSSS